MPIDRTAIVHESATVHPDAVIGPYAVVGASVVIGARTRIGAHAVVDGPTVLGEDNVVHPHAALGGPPQDLKYRDEPTRLVVGSRNVFREFMTAHRGTVTGHHETVIGDDNLFMAYSHVAHDCIIGSRTVFANSASLSGHVTVEDDVILGGFVVVKQFLRIGRFAYVGGMTPVNKDVLPFTWTSSDRDTKAYKINGVGLSRKGYSAERVAALNKAYRILYRNRHDHAAALEALAALAATAPDVQVLLDFISSSKAGVHGA
ncbi:MAG TPA: acyl-ACP--UDP-N-acetylglucosamine O-acyltransferase [Thermoanaerobaculia bacterium]|jgi:UDP-N-acetylglucosamine acyltransferase|nr:acyl-ACP--UDP-N-acetylglucosamine O-acyltransferase [Thermoanaerobaculia bacterium]HPA52395.1 acyl-ACP--UDP-N-acetylglucosamine O-acyltransferase [Thermoanaerobaculia bacterium]HQN08035.1 acyl-ACP--UDP-N-acetylglucosamine O-acyltransferase [Thermoanaerobaculia bacterium]HQP86154.1 acyl-ACP--UDP-N-acetylglucosamine O-acyltransferase [Thermoanaerobaculia bacterium]